MQQKCFMVCSLSCTTFGKTGPRNQDLMKLITFIIIKDIFFPSEKEGLFFTILSIEIQLIYSKFTPLYSKVIQFIYF